MADILQNSKDNIDWDGLSWVNREFSHPDRTIRLATSFSGIGAIEYALKRLGLKTEIIFAGDINKNCKISYFANYNISDDRWHTDIHEFDAKPFKGQVDLFVGGAPCQAFFIVGEQRGFEDTRGHLLIYMEDRLYASEFYDIATDKPLEYAGLDKLKELRYPFNVNRFPTDTYESRVDRQYIKRMYMLYGLEVIPNKFSGDKK